MDCNFHHFLGSGILNLMEKKNVYDKPNSMPLSIVRPFQKVVANQTPPNFTYRGGAIMESPVISVLLWGDAWNNAFVGFPPKLDTFFSSVVSSSLFDQLQEYNVNGKTIGHGSYAGLHIVTDPKPTKFIFDFQIRSMLQKQIAHGTVPPASPNTLYVIFTPPGSGVIKGFSISCVMFCGYHDVINENIFYAVINYPSCAGCKPRLEDFDALTVSTSHEICEAVTDPIPGTGWYDNNHGEIGDVCSWKVKQVEGQTVQQEWSEVNSRCL